MNFTASIRPGSDIDRRWAGEHRRSGIVNGTLFEGGPGGYVAAEIKTENMNALLANPAVDVVTHGTTPAKPASVHSGPLVSAPAAAAPVTAPERQHANPRSTNAAVGADIHPTEPDSVHSGPLTVEQLESNKPQAEIAPEAAEKSEMPVTQLDSVHSGPLHPEAKVTKPQAIAPQFRPKPKAKPAAKAKGH